MSEHVVDTGRRKMLTVSASVVGAAGVAVALVPFAASMSPSAEALAAGAPVEVDISKIEPGQKIQVEWRRKPVWIVKRTAKMIDTLKDVTPKLRDPNSDNLGMQPEIMRTETRSLRPDILVLVGLCTHLGCSPTYRPEIAPDDLGPEWEGGFYCPCHGSQFDISGRVYKNVPANANLEVPPYKFVDENILVVGELDEGEKGVV